MNKIISCHSLPNLIKQLRSSDIKLVLVGGCFDILHLGHVRFLKVAKKYGTLIVALESDENVQLLKGKDRPIHSQKERAEVLAANNSVDFIVLLPFLSTDKDYEELTNIIKPNFIAATYGDPQLPNKQKQAQKIGAKIIMVPKIPTPSTTQLAKLLDLD
jgi:FAD synthetase